MEENKNTIQLDYTIALDEAISEMNRLSGDLVLQRAISRQLNNQVEELQEEVLKLKEELRELNHQ